MNTMDERVMFAVATVFGIVILAAPLLTVSFH